MHDVVPKENLRAREVLQHPEEVAAETVAVEMEKVAAVVAAEAVVEVVVAVPVEVEMVAAEPAVAVEVEVENQGVNNNLLPTLPPVVKKVVGVVVGMEEAEVKQLHDVIFKGGLHPPMLILMMEVTHSSTNGVLLMDTVLSDAPNVDFKMEPHHKLLDNAISTND